MKLPKKKVIELLNLKLKTLKRISSRPVLDNANWSISERKDNAEIFADKLEQLVIYLEVLGEENFELFTEREKYEKFLKDADCNFTELSNRFCRLEWVSYSAADSTRAGLWVAWVAPIEII